MCDQLVYQLSTRNDLMESVMTKKEVVYIQDQNGGAYNGIITFETSSISNSGKFADWTNSYFVIPYVVTMTAAADLSGTTSRLSAGMKAGWWNLIHSMSVDLNGINIIQQSPFLNLYAAYKCMTSWSYNDMVKNGDSVGFWKDSVDSFQYFAAQNASGSVISNNTVIGIAAAGSIPAIPTTWAASTVLAGYNEGYFRRLVAQNYYNGGTAQFLQNAANVISTGLSVCGQATANTTFYWRYNCVIRLRDITDFFDNKVPLHRGGVYRFTLNYNSGSVGISYAAGPLFGSSGVVQSSGQSLPFMFSSGATSNPNSALAQALTSLSGAVVNPYTAAAGIPSPSISACRLYVPLYTLNEAYEEQLLTLNPEKTIQYKDLYQYTISSTSSNGNFNALVSNGLTKPLTCVIVPLADYSTINAGAAPANATGLTSLNTPFSSTPATTDPGLLVRNFNVQVSGINIFPQNIDFTFIEFQNELSKINAVNGNCTSGLTSGLIGQHEYERGYSYIVADLSRSYSADDFIPKSILVSGTNVASINAVYYVFVEYMRSVTINLASGNVRL